MDYLIFIVHSFDIHQTFIVSLYTRPYVMFWRLKKMVQCLKKKLN